MSPRGCSAGPTASAIARRCGSASTYLASASRGHGQSLFRVWMRLVPGDPTPGGGRTGRSSWTMSGCSPASACRSMRVPRSTDEFRRLGRSTRRTPSSHRLETHHDHSRTPRPHAVREHPRSGRRAQQGVLREARVQLQPDVHRRDRRLHAGRRARLRHAAQPREVRGVREAADRRSHHAHARAVLLQRVIPR